MKISDQIRAAETPKEQLQDYSNEWLAEEHDPAEVLPVDNAEEAEAAEETKPSEMEELTQAKVVRDTGFLTHAEKKLLKKHGWTVVAADDEVAADLTLKGYLEGVEKVLSDKFKGQTGDILKAVKQVLSNL
jgi:hypothetical protein